MTQNRTLPRILMAIPAAVMMLAVLTLAVQADGAWLDQSPPAGWNQPRMALPEVQAMDSESGPGRPCSANARPPETDEDRMLADAGWFLVGGYSGGWGIRVVGANTAFDGMCRPAGYQYFVFADGVFAGALSPQVMNSRADGAGGSFIVDGQNSISATFYRYTSGDPLCCPSGRSSALYSIQRTDDGPVVLLQSVSTEPLGGR